MLHEGMQQHPQASAALPVEPPWGDGGTYESIERRRAQAAETCKQLLAQKRQQQTAVYQAEQAFDAQQKRVAELKEAYAAMSYLAVSFMDEQERAQVAVRAAEELEQHYPQTQFFAHEAPQLKHGFQRAADYQTTMAEQTREEMAATAQELISAQQPLPALQQHMDEARRHLEQLTSDFRIAKETYKLLLHAKQWTRYKW